MRNYKTKKRLDTFVAVSVAMLCTLLLLGWLLYEEEPLESHPKSTSRIVALGEAFVQPPKGMVHKKVFFLQLDTPEIAMQFFTRNENYRNFLDQLWTGNTVTVYYAPVWKGQDRFEAELLQIEKDGVLLLEYWGYQQQRKEISKFLGVVGGIGLLFLLKVLRDIWKPRPYKRRKTLPTKAS